jgi:hypothetical protein
MFSVVRPLLASIVFFLIAVSVQTLMAAESKEAEPTQEQLQLQISIMQDYIKKIQADSESLASNELQKAYVEAKKRSISI